MNPILLSIMLALPTNSPTCGPSVRLAWTASPSMNVAGYKVYIGGVSGVYTNVVDVGNVLSNKVCHLSQGATYYFTATAYTLAGHESLRSNEVRYSLPPPKTNAVVVVVGATEAASTPVGPWLPNWASPLLLTNPVGYGFFRSAIGQPSITSTNY